MKEGPTDADDGHETPNELVPRASAERTFLANLAVRVGTLGSALAEASRGWDSASPDRKRALAIEFSQRLGDSGDALHEARILVRSFKET